MSEFLHLNVDILRVFWLSQRISFALWRQQVTPKRRYKFMILNVVVTHKNLNWKLLIFNERNARSLKRIFFFKSPQKSPFA